jgi:hypothetical protein
MGYLPYDITLKAIFWIATMCFLTIDGILFIKKASKVSKENKLKRDLLHALAIFFFLSIGVGLFFILSDFERDVFGESELYYRLLVIAYLFGNAAFLIIILVGEKQIIKTRYIISFITSIIIGINIVLLIFFPDLVPLARYLNYGLFGSEIGILLLIYIYLIKKTSGDFKKTAIITFIGIAIAASASIIGADFFISSGLIQPYFSPILFIIGLTICTYEVIRKEALDLLEMLAKHKMTTLSMDFWEKIDKLDWDDKDKKDFVKDMLGLIPRDRDKMINDILKKYQQIE